MTYEAAGIIEPVASTVFWENGDLNDTMLPFSQLFFGVFSWDLHWEIELFKPLIDLPENLEKIASKIMKLGDFVIPV